MSVISVIVPVYNVEPYLRRCVDSILAQTFSDFELILVDDGSPDNCPAICDEYAKQDSRVIVIHQNNGGLSVARNAGIDWAFSNSDSEWISFIDSDDWVAENYLQSLYRGVIDSSLPVSSCGFIKTIEEAENTIPEIRFSVFNTEDYYVQDRTSFIIACGKLYKKDCFKSIRYPVGKIHEDEFVTYKILFQFSQLAVIEAPLYYYYVNPSGIMHKEWSPNRLVAYDAQMGQLAFFRKKGLQKAYERTLIATIDNLANNYQQCNDKNYKRDILIKIRKTIIKNRKYVLLFVNKVPWICEMAFPIIMKLYWLINSQVNKISKR